MQNFHTLSNALAEYLPLLLFVKWNKYFHPHFIVYLLGLEKMRRSFNGALQN